ncbi:MAG: DUF4197 domain-containing protein [Acidobacteriota bacterium]
MLSAFRARLPWFLCCALVLLPGCAELDPALVESVLGTASSGDELDEPTVARGLKEALRIGASRAIDRTSKIDGFLADELIRIYLPEDLEKMAEALRKVGFARQVDELEVAMNRAAERAAGEARSIFSGAISELTIRDAFSILRGNDTAATDYLRGRTESELRARFQPIIADKMREVDLYEAYNRLADAYNALPFGQKPAVDLDVYLTNEAMDGLFATLATEERRIREDPLARTTELLRKVFSRRG